MYRLIRRRRRLAITDYNKRIEMLKGNSPRVIVRRSNRGVTMQVATYEPNGDRIITAARSMELKKLDWAPRGNIPTAYLTGMLLARKAKAKKLGKCVLDLGLYRPVKSSAVFAAAKGAVDGGLDIANSIELDAKRISGHHIAEYAKKLKADGNAYKGRFSEYAAGGTEVDKLPELFEAVKKKILEM